MAPAWDSFFHILNPSALRRPGVEARLESSSWRRIWIDRASHPTHLETAVTWAVNEGVRDLAVWGGDGTFGRVVNALHGLGALDKVRVALVPAGTCNDFSRQMGSPLWDVVVSETSDFEEVRIDVGLLSHAEGTRAFINNGGFGRRPQARGHKRPSAVMDILRLRNHRLRIEVTGGTPETADVEALLGIVFNAPYFGGGLHFSRDIAPDDGRLDAYILKNQPRWRVLWSFTRGLSTRRLVNDAVFRTSGRVIRFSSVDDLYPQADGETASEGPVQSIEFTVLPKALTLLAPCLPAGRQNDRS